MCTMNLVIPCCHGNRKRDGNRWHASMVMLSKDFLGFPINLRKHIENDFGDKGEEKRIVSLY